MLVGHRKKLLFEKVFQVCSKTSDPICTTKVGRSRFFVRHPHRYNPTASTKDFMISLTDKQRAVPSFSENRLRKMGGGESLEVKSEVRGR